MDSAALAQPLFLVVRIVLVHHVHSLHDGFDADGCCQCFDYPCMRSTLNSLRGLAVYFTPVAPSNLAGHWRCRSWHCHDVCESIAIGRSQFPIGGCIALCVPLAGATQWNLTQHSQKSGIAIDLVPSVLLGAIISSILTLPMAWPLQANAHDIRLLALLGIVQLAIPCTLSVICARVLKAPEVSLLALLEVIFGIALAWWGANEEPQLSVLIGGGLVITALFANEWFGWRQRNV